MRLIHTIALVGILALFGRMMFSSVLESQAHSGARLPDVGQLVGLEVRAKQLARPLTADPVLRQVSMDPLSGRTFFHFTDAPATFEIEVTVPTLSTALEEWQVTRPALSMLAGHGGPTRAGLELQALSINPADALRPMTTRWSGCVPRGLTLFGEGNALTWYAFCTLPDGRVAAGTVDGRSGVFRPSPAPPALPPPTAMP